MKTRKTLIIATIIVVLLMGGAGYALAVTLSPNSGPDEREEAREVEVERETFPLNFAAKPPPMPAVSTSTTEQTTSTTVSAISEPVIAESTTSTSTLVVIESSTASTQLAVTTTSALPVMTTTSVPPTTTTTQLIVTAKCRNTYNYYGSEAEARTLGEEVRSKYLSSYEEARAGGLDIPEKEYDSEMSYIGLTVNCSQELGWDSAADAWQEAGEALRGLYLIQVTLTNAATTTQAPPPPTTTTTSTTLRPPPPPEPVTTTTQAPPPAPTTTTMQAPTRRSVTASTSANTDPYTSIANWDIVFEHLEKPLLLPTPVAYSKRTIDVNRIYNQLETQDTILAKAYGRMAGMLLHRIGESSAVMPDNLTQDGEINFSRYFQIGYNFAQLCRDVHSPGGVKEVWHGANYDECLLRRWCGVGSFHSRNITCQSPLTGQIIESDL